MNPDFTQLCMDLGLLDSVNDVASGKITYIELLTLVIVKQGETIEQLRLEVGL